MTLGDGVRRDVATVGAEERARLRDAFVELNRRYYPGTRGDFPPGGVSYWFKQDEIHQATHVHGFPPYRGIAFLTWHRELCNRLEVLLREVDPLLSLHYWDWTTDPRRSPDGRGGFVDLFTPDFMGGAQGPMGEPWLSAGFYNPTSAQHRDATGSPADPPRLVERDVAAGAPRLVPSDADILAATTYPQMRVLLEQAHDAAHSYIGGTLSNPHISFRDPFVFLLHSNVDRLFAQWQVRDRARLDPDAVFGAEADTDALPGAPIYDPGIRTVLDPWAGNPTASPAVRSIRPWAPPENEQLIPQNRNTSQARAIVDPPRYDQEFPNRRGGCFLQGRHGRRGNFELVLPARAGGLAHYWRDNDATGLPWHEAQGAFPASFTQPISAVALLQSNLSFLGNGPGNLELVALAGDRLLSFWRPDGQPGPRPDCAPLRTRLAELQRDRAANLAGCDDAFGDDPRRRAQCRTRVEADIDQAVQALRACEAATGAPVGIPGPWVGPLPIEADGAPVVGVAGAPGFIQGRHGVRGNFELVVPRAAGGLAHYWRDNDADGLPWHEASGAFPATFTDRVSAVALVESNFSAAGSGPGNLELVAVTGGRLVYFWRPDGGGPSGGPGPWQGPLPIEADGVPVAGVAGAAGFIQGRHGVRGNFELVVARADGRLAHYWRDNDADDLPWHETPAAFPGGPDEPTRALSVLQRNFSFLGTGRGNLELVQVTDSRVAYSWRPDVEGPGGRPGPWLRAADVPI